MCPCTATPNLKSNLFKIALRITQKVNRKKTAQNHLFGDGGLEYRKIFISRGLPSFAVKEDQKEPIDLRSAEI